MSDHSPGNRFTLLQISCPNMETDEGNFYNISNTLVRTSGRTAHNIGNSLAQLSDAT